MGVIAVVLPGAFATLGGGSPNGEGRLTSCSVPQTLLQNDAKCGAGLLRYKLAFD